MLKSELPTKLPRGKTKKYLSYREAWTRIKLAQSEKFYLEAVTLVESIISDRLISFLVNDGEHDIADKNTFSYLITRWKKRVPTPIVQGSYPNLQEAVDNWRIQRNKVVHGMVKSLPESEPNDIMSFLEEAKTTAAEGEQLAKAVNQWRKKIKKRPPS